MPTTLTIRDETTTGDITNRLVIELLTERITVRELIRSSVYQEVKDYNARQSEHFNGLIQPTDSELALNGKGWRLRQRRMIDWQPQYEKAIDAFQRKQILVLINDKQATSLEQEVVITPETTVTFLRLIMLVGG